MAAFMARAQNLSLSFLATGFSLEGIKHLLSVYNINVVFMFLHFIEKLSLDWVMAFPFSDAGVL